MLELRYVADHVDEVEDLLARRGFSGTDLSQLTELATERRHLITEAERLRAQRNETSAALGKVKDKKSPEFEKARDAMRRVGAEVKELETRESEVERRLSDILSGIPNVPHPTTPPGLDETSNVEVRRHGARPEFDFEPKDHVDIGLGLGILDFERAAKISGARFCVISGEGARLVRALTAFMLDLHTNEHGYREVWPPVLVKDSVLFGTGQLPKFSEGVFQIAQHHSWTQHQEGEGHHLYLAPTAEAQLTNLHADEILAADQLPLTYTAYAPCFRSEAGSYGKDTRGLIRQHQFDKVELVRLVHPDQGEAELDRLTEHAETVLKRLGLHYRVVQLCAGDMSFAAQKGFDLEVWLPGQEAYREISSCSWCGDFQARRAKIRFRSAPKTKPALVHTLNGSGLAVGRTLVALLEQNQQADGTVIVPEALRPYMGGVERIRPRR